MASRQAPQRRRCCRNSANFVVPGPGVPVVCRAGRLSFVTLQISALRCRVFYLVASTTSATAAAPATISAMSRAVLAHPAWTALPARGARQARRSVRTCSGSARFDASARFILVIEQLLDLRRLLRPHRPSTVVAELLDCLEETLSERLRLYQWLATDGQDRQSGPREDP